MNYRILIAAAALLVTGAVGGEYLKSRVEPTTHTVSWFLANPDDLKTTEAACQNDPGGLDTTPNCINADDATSKQAEASLWRTTKPAPVKIINPFQDAN